MFKHTTEHQSFSSWSPAESSGAPHVQGGEKKKSLFGRKDKDESLTSVMFLSGCLPPRYRRNCDEGTSARLWHLECTVGHFE